MLSTHNGNLSQCLIFKNLRYLFLGFTVFTAWINYSPLLAQCIGENITTTLKENVDDEFKVLVENIYELLQQDHSIDDIVKMLDCDQASLYNTKKLVTHIQYLLNKQNSKCNIINIVINNKKSKKYYERTNSFNFLANATTYYLALKIIAYILAFTFICYLLSKLISGEHGFFKGAPKPKNESSAKDNGKKSDEHELHNCDNVPHPFVVQEAQEPEIVKGMPLKIPQIIQIISEQVTQGTNKDNASSWNKTNSEMVQREQAPSVICIERASLDYELRGKTDQLIASLIDLCPEFVKPPHVDISVLAAEIPAVKQPIDTRSLRVRIDEKIHECKRLCEQLSKK